MTPATISANPQNPERIVRVTHVAKSFGDHHVLHDVSLDAHRGEVIGLLGANGSGKSTILRLIAGLEKNDRGEIAVPGGTGTAVIFQKMHLVGRRSALDNVCAGGLARVPLWRSLSPVPFPGELKKEAVGCLHRVGLGARVHERVGSFSGGQQQRVAVARALCQRPEVILADEPTAALDPTAAHQVMGLLRDIAKASQVACICVIHQPELALAYCDTIVGIKQGRVAFNLPAGETSLELISTLYATETATGIASDAAPATRATLVKEPQ